MSRELDVQSGLDAIAEERRRQWDARFGEAEQKRPRDLPANGWASGAMQAAWSAITHGTSVLRDLVLRMFWDEEATPSVEVPICDFFCNGFATRALVTSEPTVVAPIGGMNTTFPMPFCKHARIEVQSQHVGDLEAVLFQVDLTTGDAIADDVPYSHAQWRRSNGTTSAGEDHVILDGVDGRGWYAGTYVALASLHRYWWARAR